jgi:hypothetical protein
MAANDAKLHYKKLSDIMATKAASHIIEATSESRI